MRDVRGVLASGHKLGKKLKVMPTHSDSGLISPLMRKELSVVEEMYWVVPEHDPLEQPDCSRSIRRIQRSCLAIRTLRQVPSCELW